jgi:large subunit ribosomal protein L33
VPRDPFTGHKATRETVSLVCNECKSRNYRTTKRQGQQIELKKHCKTCGRHTVHTASK